MSPRRRRLTKEGKNIERGVLRVSRKNRLEYDGPRSREKMWDDVRFRHRAIVKVGTSKVVRTRPKFVGWSTVVTVDFDSSIIDRARPGPHRPVGRQLHQAV